MEAEPGFAGAQGALIGAARQTGWINEQVGAGKLRLDPDAAEAAARHCEDCAAEVQRMAAAYVQIERVEGLGNYDSSRELKSHFEQKANQEGSGALSLLRDLQAEMLNQADAFRAAAKDYRATDDQIAGDLGKGRQ